MEQELFSPELLEEIRSKFYYIDKSLVGGERIFLDSVSGALRLKKMVDRAGAEIMSYAQKSRIDPASRHFAAVKERFKKDARLFLGADSGYIIPAMSGTHTIYRCINAVCSAYSAAAKNIVTSNLEHPAVYESTHQFAEKYNLERRVANFDRKKGIVPVENILKLIDKDTCLLALIHGSNITGGVNDVARIVREARAINPEIYVVIDGVQYAPHRLIDVEELDVDAYAISGYKIYCKKASGIGYISERFDQLPHWQLRERPSGEWAIGAEDESSYAGFSAVISYLKWLGGQLSDSADRKARNEMGNSDYQISSSEEIRKSDEEENRSDQRSQLDERTKIELAMRKISSHTKELMRLVLNGFEGYSGFGEPGNFSHTKVRGLRQMENVKILGLEYCLRRSYPAEQVNNQKDRLQSAELAKDQNDKLKPAELANDQKDRLQSAELADDQKDRLQPAKLADDQNDKLKPAELTDDQNDGLQSAELADAQNDRLDYNNDGQNIGQYVDLEDRTGLIAFRIEGRDSNKLAERYFKEAGISLSTRERNIYGRHVLEVLGVDDLIRLSICHYNSPEEIKRFLQATEKFQSES